MFGNFPQLNFHGAGSGSGRIYGRKTIAFEYARYGIRANVVSPGCVRTEMGDAEMGMFQGGDIEEGYRRVTKLLPARRTPRRS